MALDILTQDIIIDETTGIQDDDVNPSVPPHSTNTTLTYLLSLDSAGGLTSPEVAFQADFVVATASAGETITSVVLAQNLAGTPFSTTVGVNSGIQTVDGNYVWLFQDATHANVVIGVIGTSNPATQPAATDPLAFSFALINTSNTNADLYTVQYVPLFHPDATNPDDQIDLSNKVFASVTGTTVANFSGQNAAPGIHQFYLINSSNDASKQALVTGFLGATNANANVSTQGFGVDNQSINPTETLQVDFVTGGTVPAGDGSQIQYTSHLDNITQGGFTINQITPSNPNLRVDIRISAFDVQGNEQGSDFFNGSPTNPVDITSLKLTGQSGFAATITVDGTYATGSGNVTVTGLSGNGNIVTITGLDNITTVDVTTSSPMDRLRVADIDSNEGLDITEFHFLATSTNAHSEEVGSFINFDDDGPSAAIVATGASVVMDESIGERPADSSGTADPNDTADDNIAGNPFPASYGTPIGLLSNVDLVNTTTTTGSDDEGATTHVTLSIVGGNGTDSLLLTTDNSQISLFNESGVIVGRVDNPDGTSNAAGTVAFAISINDLGEVTVAQYLSLKHPTSPDNYDESVNLGSLVNAVVTVTDGDKDVATQSIGIGNAIQFQDDGPTAAIVLTGASVVMDESIGERPADSSGTADPNDTADDNIAGNPFPASYGTPIGLLSNVDLVNTTTTTGSDDEGATTHVTLSIVGGNGTDSLLLTTDNSQISLFNESGVIVGRVDNPDGTSNAAGTVAFAISINDLGEVTVAQYLSLKHPTSPDNYDESVNLGSLVNAVVTVTDGDKDVATQSIGIGNAIQFQDDGPTAAIVLTGASVVMDESIGERPADSSGTADPNDTADDNIAGNPFPASYGTPIGLLSNVDLVNTTTTTGSDDEGATTHVTLSIVGGNGTDSLLLTTDNSQISLFNESGVIVGRVDNPDGTSNAAGTVAFAISINDLGEVTVAQYLSLKHPTSPDNYDESVNLGSLVNAVVTVTDGDKDVATQSIGIGNAIQFQDDGPTAAIVLTGASVVMDESIGERPADSSGTADPNDTADDNIAGNPFPASYGTPIGLLSNVDLVNTTTTTGSDDEGATTHVTLSIVGGNGTDSLLLTTDNSQISLFNESGVIVGRVDNPDGTSNAAGTVAFAISINDLGEVTVAQYLSLKHPTSPDNYDESVNLGSLVNAVVTVTDGDKDVATQSIGIGNAIQFQDDGPTAAIVLTGASVVMDESIGERPADSSGTADPNDTADDNIAGNPFPASYGTPIGLLSNVDLVNTTTTTGSDDEGATTHVTLSIVGGNGTDSLLLTTDNSQISLFNESGVIVGRVDNPDGTSNAAGTVAFAISINDLGEVTVAQYLSLKHPTSPDNYDESVNLGSLVNAVVTVTDGDKDVATQSIGIGNAIQFQDDGPTAAIVLTGASVVMDESIGERPADSSGTADPNDTADDNIAGNPFPASYGTPIGLLSNVDLVNTTTTTGSDDEGATTHVTLSIVGGNGTDSLLLTTDNSQISLFNESGVIVGRVDNPDGTSNAAGTVAFAISINDLGEVTVAQYLSLKHPTSPDNYDESVNLGSLVNAVVTVTDGDKDVATQSIGIGNAIQFQDDGPTAAIVLTGASVVMDESIGERPADSSGTADPNDTADDNIAGNPFPASYGTPIGLLSNVDLVNTTTTTGSDDEGATTHVTLSIVGGNGTDSLLLTTDNSQISLFNESGVIVGRVDNPDGTSNAAGTVAFAISINDLGEVTVAQYLSLKHPTSPDNYDESVNLGSLVNAVVTVTDGDKDVATQSIGIGNAIQFQDDGPTAAIVLTGASVVMDESIGERPADSSGTADPNDTADDNIAGNPFPASYGTPIGLLSNVDLVNTTTTTGSDDEGATTHVTLSIVGGNGTDSLLLTTDNSQISLFNESGVIVGRVDNPDGTSNAAGTVAFAISINDLGEVTVAQYLSLKHPTSPDNYDESVNLGSLVNAVVTVTDGDKDVATQSIGIGNAIQFQDDGPTAAIVLTGASVVMDESIGERPADSSGTADPNDTADDNIAGNPFPASYGTPIGLLSNVDLVNTTTTTGSDDEGATTHVTLSIVGGNGTDSLLLTTDNSQISLFNESGVIVGRVDNPDGTSNAAGTVAFAISINDLGEVTVAQYLSLKHPTSPDNYDESVNLGSLVNAVVTVTDGDKDVATQSIGIGNAIQFQDDGPTAAIVLTGASVVMDESIGERPADSSGTADPNDTADDNIAGNPFPASYGTPIGLLSNVDLVNTTTTTGSDDEGATTHVTLSIVGGNGTDSLLLTTDNSQISLFNESGVIVGRVDNPDGTSNAAGTVAFAISINDLGEVTVAQYLSLKHPTSPDNYDESVNLGSLVNAVVTVTDGDKDVATQSIGIGNAIQFQDDGPTAAIVLTGASVVMDESIGERPADSSGTADPNDTADDNIAGNPFPASYGTPIGLLSNVDLVNTTTTTGSDDEGATTHVTLSIVGGNGTDSLLLTTDNSQISLFNESGVIVGRVDNPDGTSNAAGTVAFAISINDLGEVTVAQYLSLKHPTSPDNYDESVNLGSLVNAVVTVTDGDKDVATQSIGIGNAIQFQDDGPTITVPPEALTLDNTADPITNTAAFGYDIGSDDRTTYSSTNSDFVDSNAILAGIQLALAGTVGDPQNFIKNTDVTLQTESASSAVFDFTFQYDANPNVPGDQLATANGSLSFDKAFDTYTVSLDAPIQGFSVEVLQTSELLAKVPIGNSGQPLVVVEKLAPDPGPNPFYVQFTADNTPLSFSPTGDTPNTGDTVFNGAAHDMAGGAETWVSATQSTNGVAGDTIQKDELLTLRFFKENILNDAIDPPGPTPATEKTDPTATVSGLVVKFDGIGASEDLVVILDLKDDKGTATTADDVEITRAVLVDNGDLIQNSTPGGVPFPYSTQFSLDNNDGLLIIESNDYNLNPNEHYQIQGVQIMQSANGLTGTGINLNGATGVDGGSGANGTQSFTEASFGNEQDVLKITDIGLVRAELVPQDAHLDFSFQIVDGDGDTTATQQLHVDVLNA